MTQKTGRFINADDTAYVDTNTGTPLSTNMFAYCENNPIHNVDRNGTVSIANIVGGVIGGIVGAIGGYFLSNWFADKLKLSGWKRNVFVWGLTAVITATSVVIGYFIGPYVAKIVTKLGHYVAKLIRKGKVAFKRLSKKAKSSVKTLKKRTCCFVVGTKICISTGYKNIENIDVGDYVYSSNSETGESELKKVINVY